MALYYLIMSLLGAPLMIASYWGLMRPAVRWWRERGYRKPEWNKVTAGRMTSSTDLDALRAAYGTFVRAPTADIDIVPSIVPAVYSNASGAATTMPATLVTPVR